MNNSFRSVTRPEIAKMLQAVRGNALISSRLPYRWTIKNDWLVLTDEYNKFYGGSYGNLVAIDNLGEYTIITRGNRKLEQHIIILLTSNKI